LPSALPPTRNWASSTAAFTLLPASISSPDARTPWHRGVVGQCPCCHGGGTVRKTTASSRESAAPPLCCYSDPTTLALETRTLQRRQVQPLNHPTPRVHAGDQETESRAPYEMRSTGHVLMASAMRSSGSAHCATTRARLWTDSMAKVLPAWSAHLRQPTQATSSMNTARDSLSAPRHDE